MTAALYGARARANTVVFELGLPGGQIIKTELVENYPAFPDGVSGADLGEFMHQQAERFGAEFRTFSPVEAIRREGDDFVVLGRRYRDGGQNGHPLHGRRAPQARHPRRERVHRQGRLLVRHL